VVDCPNSPSGLDLTLVVTGPRPSNSSRSLDHTPSPRRPKGPTRASDSRGDRRSTRPPQLAREMEGRASLKYSRCALTHLCRESASKVDTAGSQGGGTPKRRRKQVHPLSMRRRSSSRLTRRAESIFRACLRLLNLRPPPDRPAPGASRRQWKQWITLNCHTWEIALEEDHKPSGTRVWA
jgi:hypothetical protein